MIYFEPHPVLIQIGFLEIRYYSLMYILGIILAYFIIKKIHSKREIEFQKDELLDDILFIFIFIIIFARVFYTLYYNFQNFIHDPLVLFRIWEGGMSFHGGLIGAIIAGIIISKKKKTSFLKLADLFVVPIPLALAFGRIGNLLNGEIYGTVVNRSLPWAFYFISAPDLGTLPRHPYQIYEFIQNIIIFIILWKLYSSKKEIFNQKGFVFFSFVFLYGTFRFILEFFREPDFMINLFMFSLTAGQLLCLIMIFVSLPFLINSFLKTKRKTINYN